MGNVSAFPRIWRTVRNTVPRSLLIIAIVLMLVLLGAPLTNRATLTGSTLVSSTVGSFEIDGNLIVDHTVPPTEPIDWDSNPFPAALTTFTDGSGPKDDIFGLG